MGIKKNLRKWRLKKWNGIFLRLKAGPVDITIQYGALDMDIRLQPIKCYVDSALIDRSQIEWLDFCQSYPKLYTEKYKAYSKPDLEQDMSDQAENLDYWLLGNIKYWPKP